MKHKTATLFVGLAIVLAMATLLSLFHLSPARAGENAWTTTGPYGVTMMELVIDPANSQTIFATTPDGPASVYKSTDGGLTWLPSSNGIPEHANAAWNDSLVIDARRSDTLYVATERGVYKSVDAGQTWTQKSMLVEDGVQKLVQAWSMAISPADGTLFVGGYDNPMGAGAGGGIFRSRDGGETWERLGNGAPTGSVRSLKIAPSAAHILYAGSDDQGIVKSMDSGASWQPVNAGFATNPAIAYLAVDPFDAQVVYMSTHGQGIYKTTDGGQHWMPIGSGLDNSDVRAIAIDPGNQQVIYVGGGPDSGTPGVYRSLDNQGLSWAPMMEGMGSRVVWSLAMDQNIPQNIYAGTASGIWKYTLVAGPEDYSISINAGDLFTNQTTVTLTLTAPAGTSEMMISNEGGFNDASWEPFVTEKSWTITAYGAHVIPRIVYAKFKTHGQISGLYQDDIVLDVTAPTGSVQVAGPIETAAPSGTTSLSAPSVEKTGTLSNSLWLPLLAKNYHPGLTLVGLSLSASDDLSGVADMIISNDASFVDAQWEPYVTERNWWARDAETAAVYVKFRDGAGNQSPAVSASVPSSLRELTSPGSGW